MATLTQESLHRMFEQLQKLAPQPREPSMLDFLHPRKLCGLDVFEAPPPPPKVQLRDIQHADGSSILTPEFRASMQAWLTARFGYQEDLFKDHAYILGGHSVIVSKSQLAILNNSIT